MDCNAHGAIFSHHLKHTYVSTVHGIGHNLGSNFGILAKNKIFVQIWHKIVFKTLLFFIIIFTVILALTSRYRYVILVCKGSSRKLSLKTAC